MYLIYTVLYGSLFVLALPYLAFRSVREKGYARSVLERLGLGALPPADRPSVWVHAVSVGEVLAAATLLPALSRAFPAMRVVCSVTTTTGRALARDKLKDAAEVFYCPFDFPVLVRRVARRVRPVAFVAIETEIWPALIHETRRAGARTAIVNARISDKSFPRYLRARWFLAPTLRTVDRVLAQDALYAERFTRLGAAPERVRVIGSLKFDAGGSAPSTEVNGLTLPEGRAIVVGGSTLEPEERILLDVLESLRRSKPERKPLLVLAPRHPRRFDEVYSLVQGRGFRSVRRSSGDPVTAETDVLVLDTLGELDALYAFAEVVFVGGSLADWGGHNIIEPAARSKPVLFGPHMQNFRDIARIFLEAEAAVQIRDAFELTEAVEALLDDPERRLELGRRALEVVGRHRGATERTVAALGELFP